MPMPTDKYAMYPRLPGWAQQTQQYYGYPLSKGGAPGRPGTLNYPEWPETLRMAKGYGIPENIRYWQNRYAKNPYNQEPSMGGLSSTRQAAHITRGMENFLADEYSWLFGGRPLSQQEKAKVMPAITEDYDPRFGTIGGFGMGTAMPQQPAQPTLPPGGGYGAKILPGKGPTPGMAADVFPPGLLTTQPPVEGGYVPTGPPGGDFPGITMEREPIFGGGAGGGLADQPDWPKYEEEPPPDWAMRDVEALKDLPYQLLDQYKRIANEGIYGIPGIHTIIRTGIRPAMERYERLIPETLTSIRQAEGFLRDSAARALGKSLGGKFASQPGLAAKLIGDQVLAPSLARQAEMSMDLHTMVAGKLAALDLAVGDLMKENMQSKMMGLAGVQDVMGFLQGRVADRWWDTTMENKFGWSPERIATAKGQVQDRLMRLAHEMGIDMMELEYKFREWLMSRQYELEEYG